MSWNNFKFMMIEDFYPSHKMQKLETELWNHVMVRAGHAAYTDRFHELARLVPHLVTPESRKIKRYVYSLAPQIRGMVAATEPKTMQKVVQISGALTDKAVRNGSIKKVEKRGNVGEPSKDKNGFRDLQSSSKGYQQGMLKEQENTGRSRGQVIEAKDCILKRTRTGNAFAITANPVGRENTGAWPKCTTCNFFYAPGGPCRTCFNSNRPGHLARDCKVVPKNVNPVNVRNPTPALGACYECESTDHLKPACPRLNKAQGPGGNRPNQVVANGFRVMETKGTKLGVGHSCIEPSELGFRYEIEIASGQLVEIDKVIKGCKLEIEGHVFDIDLIPFGHGSFDVIIGMDWLSNHKAEIICHEKVVRIPLPDGKVLRVLGERPEEKARLLMSAKASDKKQEEIVVVRDFPKVFPDDLSGLPPLWEIEFRIELILGAVLIAKFDCDLGHHSRMIDEKFGTLDVRLKRLEKIKERQEYSQEVRNTDELYLAFGRHLKEIHVTWDYLEKKWTRLRTNTKTLQNLKPQRLETASPFIHDAITLHLVMASQHFLTTSARADSTQIKKIQIYDGITIKM
ncbi:putative reverse transcriptase domain-containing protein [Tanacetum coccineum]